MPKTNELLERGIIKTMPRKWTESDVAQLLELASKGLDNVRIGELMNRSSISIQIKRKRLQKTDDTYNDKHRHIKYSSNQRYIDIIQPKSVLDVYAGYSWYKDKVPSLTTNDMDAKFDTDYNMDAFKLLCKLYAEDKRYDVVDLDPYGSAVESFALALKLAKKGIIITLGEMGHRRWRRTDFVERWYGLEAVEQITPRNLILGLIRIAAQQKRTLTCLHVDNFANLSRAYFTFGDLKITKQWSKAEEPLVADSIFIDDLRQSSLFSD